MASAEFTVNAATVPPAAAVAALSVVTLALVSVSGVRTAEWSIVGNHSSAATNPAITPAGSPNGASATFTMPAGSGQSYIVRCVVNGGQDENGRAVAGLTKQALIGVTYDNSTVLPFACGETVERSLVYGYTESLNATASASHSGALVTSASASVTPTVAENAEYYILSHAAPTFVIPTNAAQAFNVGKVLIIIGTAGQVAVDGASVTLVKPSDCNAESRVAGSTIALKKVATNTWHLAGDLEVA